MKQITLTLAAITLMAACKTADSYHLPADRMEKVLLDIQLAEVYGSMAGRDTAQNTGVRNNDSLAVYYREVLAHHKITLKEFKESLAWYRQNPDKLDSIYVRAVDRLSKDEQRGIK